MNKIRLQAFLLLTALTVVAAACAPPTPAPAPVLKVGVLIDANSENDRSFNEYTLKGAREAAAEEGLEFFYFSPDSTSDFERSLESLIAEGPDLVITVGFRMGDATAKAALRYPDVQFAIMDTAFYPGAGCAETVADCYTEEGGLSNVTSLMFAEDEVAYLAGVLAACMSETGAIGSVAGMEIPPVVRFVAGFQNGARSVQPAIRLLNEYIPDFNDPPAGKVVAQDFISQGADVIFGVAGNTGSGALIAAQEAGLMAIGVDVDQYYTVPEAQSALLTSASKNVDIAAATAVRDFANGRLTGGIRTATLANGGVGLSPYHEWDARIPETCKNLVSAAREAIVADPTLTGAK